MGCLKKYEFEQWPEMGHFITSNILPYEVKPNISGFTNSLGMRDQEYMTKKEDNIFRIVVLGDSITMYGKYTDLLEEWLNKESGIIYEVWNCGIAGQGIVDYYNNLKLKCIKYKPDMIIIGFCLNDFHLTRVIFKSANGKLQCYRPTRFFDGNTDNWLYCHSYAYRTILLKLEGNKPITPYQLGKKYLSAIKNITENNTIPLLTVIFPYFIPDSENTREYITIRKVINELDIECIDLHTIFDKADRTNYLDSPETDVLHPNIAADKIIANTIKYYLIDNKIITTEK